MVTENTSYRAVLREEFETRCSRNSLYSLRAFARDLKISPARISEIFSGKQGLSVVWAEKIASRLGYTAAETQVFCDLVQAESGKSELKRRLARTRLAQRASDKESSLQLDAFQAIADWHHFALLELTTIARFKSDADWIAKRLGVSESAASLAIERLIRLGLLERASDGKLMAKDDFNASPDGIPSAALKQYHRQILEKALYALYRQSVSERSITNMILSFDQSSMQEAKELIKKFRRGFSRKLPASKVKDSVYCLSIQFFRLDEPRAKGGRS